MFALALAWNGLKKKSPLLARRWQIYFYLLAVAAMLLRR
jgi:hypothetical protein